MINRLLHKDIENNLTVNFRPLDSVMLNRPIIPRSIFFHHGVPVPCTRIAHSFYFPVLSVHSLPSIFSSRIYRAFGHSIFLVRSSRFPLLPSPCSMPLEADINGLSNWGTSRRSELRGKKLEYLFHQLPPSWAEIW